MKTTIEMARDAGITCFGDIHLDLATLERFAALVRADEREACITAINNIERHRNWITRAEAIEAINNGSNT